MRRMICLGIVAIAVMLGLMVPTTAATAAEPVTPVTPIPDLPSNTVRMAPDAVGVWRAQLWYMSQKTTTDLVTIPSTGTKVAVPLKPITPAATFTRGAAGGPLVGSFMAGFAIGTAGLQLYGVVSGNDPLDGICGSGFEGIGSIMYMGMMPECSAPVLEPNGGLTGWSDVSAYGWSWHLVGTAVNPNSPSDAVACWTFSKAADAAAGSWGWINSTGQWQGSGSGPTVLGSGTSGWIKTACGYPGGEATRWSTSVDRGWPGWEFPRYGFKRSATGEIVSSVQSSVDPVRKPSCTIQWDDGTTTTGAGTDYHESAGLPMSVGGLGCKNAWDAKPGAGTSTLPSRIGVESEDESGAKTQIADADVPDFDATQRKALDPTQGNGRGLVLEKVVNGAWQSCNTWEADCAGWWDTSSQGTNGDTYRCTFGGNGVALTECGPYRNTFDTQTSTPTITDPITGQPVPWSGTATNPGTIADGVTGGGACGAAWSWNPVDWVLNPLKCAFIPSVGSVTAAQAAVAAAWGETMPGKLPQVVQPLLTVPDLGSGCLGPHVDFTATIPFSDAAMHVDMYPLAACEAPMSDVAAWARNIGAAILIFYTGLGIVRRISATVNAPGVGGGGS